MLKTKLTELIKQTNLSITNEQIDLLIHYVDMLNKWNKAYNLTSIRSPDEMLIKHIIDSLVVSPYLRGNTFIDVGTGAGIPGVPLAIINPDKRFDLVDSLGKRIRFLKQVQFELNIQNITPIQSRIEQCNHQQFDGVISRAFASLSDMLNWCHHLPNQKGLFYALKGNINQDELKQLPNHFTIKQIIELNIPQLNAKRHLIII